MPCIEYTSIKFSAANRAVIDQANEIINEYAGQGYDLTLRQLYYQFVSRDLLANNLQSYKRLGSIINDGRLAGLIDWNRIEDRTRGVEALATWGNPAQIVSACASQFRTDRWAKQPYYPEVWIEKEALAGVFERICQELRVPYLSCRGYASQSEMWRAGQRFQQAKRRKKTPIIFHFGDHDPSGMDMSRDIADRLKIFMGGVTFERLALNMDQVEEHAPPPNPAKITDSRAEAYIAEFGGESWELDALDPTILSGLVRDAVDGIIDRTAWNASIEDENKHRRLLTAVAEDWNNLTDGL